MTKSYNWGIIFHNYVFFLFHNNLTIPLHISHITFFVVNYNYIFTYINFYLELGIFLIVLCNWGTETAINAPYVPKQQVTKPWVRKQINKYKSPSPQAVPAGCQKRVS